MSELSSIQSWRSICWYFVPGILASLSSPSWASTDLPEPWRSASSPSGQYILEAIIPDRKGVNRQTVPWKCTLDLKNAKSGDLLWRRDLAEDEGFPYMLFVHDDGRGCYIFSHNTGCIITYDDEIVCLSPRDGTPTHRFRVLEYLDVLGPADGMDIIIKNSRVIEIKWIRFHFLTFEKRLHFVFRTLRDRRLVIDLDGASVVRHPRKDLLKAADADDAEYALSKLSGETENLKNVDGNACCSGHGDSYAAICIAAQLGLKEAIPLLRKLEEIDIVGLSGSILHNITYLDGDIDPFNYKQATLRLRAHLALRLLGEKPRELPCNKFRYIRSGKPEEEVILDSLPVPRAKRVNLLKTGMKPLEILKVIGSPDYLNRILYVWEYDMDDQETYTLRLYFRDCKTLDKIERVTPPIWQQPSSRWDDEES